VILIDELDRCRPTYAIEMLEAIKHWFCVPNVVFVLAMDREQLSHSIRAVYGQGFDVDGYFLRFFHLLEQMPSLNETGGVYQKELMTVEFFRQMGIPKEYLPYLDGGKSPLFLFINNIDCLNLRECQKIYAEWKSISLLNKEVDPWITFIFCFLKVKYPSDYARNFVNFLCENANLSQHYTITRRSIDNMTNWLADNYTKHSCVLDFFKDRDAGKKPMEALPKATLKKLFKDPKLNDELRLVDIELK
jgi:hypothetical protein